MDATEIKWIAIAMIFVMGFMFVAITFSEREKAGCRVEAIKQHMSADDIERVCK